MTVLAKDIAHCACGDWTFAVKQLRFDWPLPGMTGDAAPALGAFLGKQIQDFSVKRILATKSAAARLPSVGLECTIIPDLEQIQDADAKRVLWRQLQAPLRAAAGNS